jgi:hypothetical protein
MSRFHFRLSSFVCLLLWTAPLSWGQRTTADVIGTVTDSTGAVMPGVKIVVKNQDTNAEFLAVTDDTGNYTVTLLPIGRYHIRLPSLGSRRVTSPA